MLRVLKNSAVDLNSSETKNPWAAELIQHVKFISVGEVLVWAIIEFSWFFHTLPYPYNHTYKFASELFPSAM